MPNPPAKFDPIQQRARAKRTVVILALVAFVIYVGFIAQTVLGR